jgi:hypothetical protein
MTDEKLIRTLLIAFYNGKTTQEEEAVLREFFNMKNISEEWDIDRKLFHALYDQSVVEVSEKFSERLEKNIDLYIKQKNDNSKYIKPKKIIDRHFIRRLSITAGSVAATILLLLGIFLSYNKFPNKNDVVTDTFTDPHEAAVVAEKILMAVSVNLNKGLLPFKKIKENVDKTNEILHENMIINN